MSTTQTVLLSSDTASTASSKSRRPRSFVMISPRKAVNSIIHRRPSNLSDEQSRRSVSAPMERTKTPSKSSAAATSAATTEPTSPSPLRNAVSSSTTDSSVSGGKRSSVHVHSPHHGHGHQRRTTLSFPAVADLFVKLRRVQTKAKQNRMAGENGEGAKEREAGIIRNNSSEDNLESPKHRSKSNHIECSSGPELITHPVIIQDTSTSEDGCVQVIKRARLTVRDTFTCMGGVDCVKLLRASRTTLLEKAAMFQTNALVEEEWSLCVVCPKRGTGGHYRVQIVYAASAARITSPQRDPGQPVALDRVQNVPGLMTILDRNIEEMSVQLLTA